VTGSLGQFHAFIKAARAGMRSDAQLKAPRRRAMWISGSSLHWDARAALAVDGPAESASENAEHQRCWSGASADESGSDTLPRSRSSFMGVSALDRHEHIESVFARRGQRRSAIFGATFLARIPSRRHWPGTPSERWRPRGISAQKFSWR